MVGRIAELENVVSALQVLKGVIALEQAAQIRALENFAGGKRLVELGELFEEQRSEFDALDFVGQLRFGSGRGLWSDEEFHSNCIAWLLDPRGSHGIGDAVLKSFLEQTAAPNELLQADWSQANVIREWETLVSDRWGYLDILIVNQSDRVLCAIENKVFSSEHSEQLTRYRKALADSYPDFTRHHIFLTPRGTQSYRKEERKYWTPAAYATVLNIVRQIVDDNSNTVKEDVLVFLQQYATTLRRNIVPDPSTNIREMVRAIYSGHKGAIDLIIQHKPDYIAEMKQAFRSAIKQQPEKWILDWEEREIVFFRSADWDRFEAFKTGTGWGNLKSLVTLGFDLREDCPTLIFTLGPGSDEHAREKIYQAANHVSREMRTSYTRLDVKGPILNDSEVENWMDEEATRAKIEAWVKNFAENEFPAMNEVIVNCLREYEAEQGCQ